MQRFQNFADAYGIFGRVFERYHTNPGDEITQMALIQAFEFTFELAWKTMKDYLDYEGFATVSLPGDAVPPGQTVPWRKFGDLNVGESPLTVEKISSNQGEIAVEVTVSP